MPAFSPSASNIPVSPAFDFLAGAGTAVGGIWDIIKSDSASEPESKRNIVVPFSKVYVTFLSQWVLNFARRKSTKSDHIKTILGLHSTLVFIEKLQ